MRTGYQIVADKELTSPDRLPEGEGVHGRLVQTNLVEPEENTMNTQSILAATVLATSIFLSPALAAPVTTDTTVVASDTHETIVPVKNGADNGAGDDRGGRGGGGHGGGKDDGAGHR